MSLLKAFVCWLSLVLVVPAPLAAGTKIAPHRWQEGELISRKTIPTGSPGMEYKYVYRLRSSDAHYVIVAKEPLKVNLQVPIKFATGRRHVVIQDSDGQERKVSLRKKVRRAFGLWR
ncbi:MAG TPA: hypothetical protein VGH38_05340 [Bryobacteraceae bacterium]|jgi:hypothetical protein